MTEDGRHLQHKGQRADGQKCCHSCKKAMKKCLEIECISAVTVLLFRVRGTKLI